MGSRKSTPTALALSLFAGLSAAAMFLLTAGEWIVLSTHYAWCRPVGCSQELRFSAYAVVLAGSLVASALAFWGTRKLILRLQR